MRSIRRATLDPPANGFASHASANALTLGFYQKAAAGLLILLKYPGREQADDWSEMGERPEPAGRAPLCWLSLAQWENWSFGGGRFSNI